MDKMAKGSFPETPLELKFFKIPTPRQEKF